jgi:hypothetical protein
MDSKQLATLAAPRSSKFTITDCHDIVNKKIIVNRMSIESLKLQMELSDDSIKLQNMTRDLAMKKLKLVEQLNDVWEKQLGLFDEGRKLECMNITEDINKLDVLPTSITDVINRLENTRDKLTALIMRIMELESMIPEAKNMDQFTLRFKDMKVTTPCSNEATIPIDGYAE